MCFGAFSSYGSVQDSLLNIWEDESKEDSVRLKSINIYVKILELKKEIHILDSMTTLYQAYAKKTQLIEHVVSSDISRASFKKLTGDTVGYVKELNRILEIAKKEHLLKRVIAIELYLADNTQDVKKANEILNEVLKNYEHTGLPEQIGSVYANLGLNTANMGDLHQAVVYLKKGMYLLDKVEQHSNNVKFIFNLGFAQVYFGLKNFKRAEELIEKSLKLKNVYFGIDNYAIVHNHLGYCCIELKKYDKAISEFTKTYDLAIDIDNKVLQSYAVNNIGEVYLAKEEYENAKVQFEKALVLKQSIYDTMSVEHTNLYLGKTLYFLNDYNKAKSLLTQAYNFFNRTNDNYRITIILETLYKVCEKTGDFDDAYKYVKEYLRLKEQEEDQETELLLKKMDFTKDSIASAQIKQEEERAHSEELAKRVKTKNIALVSGGFILLLAIGLFSRLRYVNKSKRLVEIEKHRSDELLLNILPTEVAEELKNTGSSEAKHFDEVSILFTDFKGFTQASELLSAKDLVNEINTCFKAFDHICDKYGIEKIKTIGDSYMAASGLGHGSKDKAQSSKDAAVLVSAALDMQYFMTTLNFKPETRVPSNSGINFEMRCGIHTGPVVAGIVGVKKFQYDIWGDTVNTASRMESHGEVGKVNISQATYELLKGASEFSFEEREELEIKGKGRMQTYFVVLAKQVLDN